MQTPAVEDAPTVAKSARPFILPGRGGLSAALIGAVVVAVLAGLGLLTGGRFRVDLVKVNYHAFPDGMNLTTIVGVNFGDRPHDPVEVTVTDENGVPSPYRIVGVPGNVPLVPEITGEVIGPDADGHVALRGNADPNRGFQRMEHVYVLQRVLQAGERWEFTALVAPAEHGAETGLVVIGGVELTDVECLVEDGEGAACSVEAWSDGATAFRVSPLPAGAEIRVAATVGSFVEWRGGFAGSVGTTDSRRTLAGWTAPVALLAGLATNWWWKRRRRARWGGAATPGRGTTDPPAWVLAVAMRGRVDSEVVDAWAAQAVADGVLRIRRRADTLRAGPRLHDLPPAEWAVVGSVVDSAEPVGLDQLRSPWKLMEPVLRRRGEHDGWWSGPPPGRAWAVGGALGAVSLAIAWAVWSGWSNERLVGLAIMVVIPATMVIGTHLVTERWLTADGVDAAGVAWAWRRRLDQLDAHRVEEMFEGLDRGSCDAAATKLALAAAATGRSRACRQALRDARVPLRVKVRVDQVLGAARLGELRRVMDETQWLVEVPVSPSRR